MYGYDRIPTTRLQDVLPVQRANRSLELEEQVRDVLVSLGLQEVINYRLTSPEREALLLPKDSVKGTEKLYPPEKPDDPGPLGHAPIPAQFGHRYAGTEYSSARAACLFSRLVRCFSRRRKAIYPMNPVGWQLPSAGLRQLPTWDQASKAALDFFDLKGIIEAMLDMLHVKEARYEPAENPTFHPGKCARVFAGETVTGGVR